MADKNDKDPSAIDALLWEVERTLGFSMSSSASGEDSELERRIDMQRILRTRDKAVDHVTRISEKCDRLSGIVTEMDQVYQDTERLLHTVAPRNIAEAILNYVRARFSGRHVRSIDDYLLQQVGNIRRFNVELGKLIIAARTQLDASTREYTEFSETIEILEARQRHYQPEVMKKQALYDSFDALVRGVEPGDKNLPRYETGRRLLGICLSELRHAMNKYTVQHDGVQEAMQSHALIEDRLRDYSHGWEGVYAFSVPFEHRALHMRMMLPQMIAQQGLATAVHQAMALLTSYNEDLRSRMDGKLFAFGKELNALPGARGYAQHGTKQLLGE